MTTLDSILPRDVKKTLFQRIVLYSCAAGTVSLSERPLRTSDDCCCARSPTLLPTQTQRLTHAQLDLLATFLQTVSSSHGNLPLSPLSSTQPETKDYDKEHESFIFMAILTPWKPTHYKNIHVAFLYEEKTETIFAPEMLERLVFMFLYCWQAQSS